MKKFKGVSFYIYLIIALVIAFVLYNKISSLNNNNKFKTKIIPEAVKKILNNSSTKFSIGSVEESSGVYKFELKIGEGSNVQKYTSYISKDGKLLFTSGINLDSLKNQPQAAGAQTEAKKLTCTDLTKAEKPSLTAFIVSDCPYGLQMQRVMKKAISELPAIESSVIIRYLGSVSNNKITSMHGDKEAQENLKQICIREEQKDKYWPYVACYMQEGKSDECSSSTGIDVNGLKACTEDKNRGLKFASADFDLANKFSIGGSPTLLINDKQIVSEFDFGGRVPDALKQIVCCAGKTKADFCSQEISKEAVASSFSTTDAPASGSTATNSAAGCGN